MPRRPKVPLLSRRDAELTPRRRAEKALLLLALSLARRRKEDLDNALRRLRIDPEQVPKNTVKKVRGKLVPKVRDRIPRSLKFYEKGRLRHAEIANSEVTSDIGRYWNAVGRLAETGKSAALCRLRRKRFKDMDGTFHTLENDSKVILKLEARRPVPELFEIYER